MARQPHQERVRIFHEGVTANGAVGILLDLLDVNSIQLRDVFLIHALQFPRRVFSRAHKCFNHVFKQVRIGIFIVSLHELERLRQRPKSCRDIAWDRNSMFSGSVLWSIRGDLGKETQE
jgi:hypothetical protein